MKAYEAKTQQIMDGFLRSGSSFPDCIASLDAALADLIPRLTKEQIAPLRALMLNNNGAVMEEMERRTRAS